MKRINEKMIYQPGQLARLTVQWETIPGTPADPTTTFVEIQAPDGTQSTIPAGSIVRDGTGAYHYDLLVTESGNYTYEWSATGVLVGTQAGYLTVASPIFVPLPTVDIDLCSVDDVRYWLNLKQTQTATPDLKIARLITAASQMILDLTFRDSFTAPVSYTEKRNGNNTYQIAPYKTPVLSVSSVTASYGAAPLTIQPSVNGSTGWVNDSYRIYLIGNYFPWGLQNITLSYSAGFTAVPSDVRQACIELVAQKWTRSTHIDQDSQKMGDNQVILFSKLDIPAEVRTVINHYRLYAVVE